MSAADRELLSALLDHDASGWIPEIHLDDCEDDACRGCEPQHLAERASRIDHLINPTAEDWARIDAQHVQASKGERLEYAHLKYDADSDAVTRPFTYLGKGISARLIDGGKA